MKKLRKRIVVVLCMSVFAAACVPLFAGGVKNSGKVQKNDYSGHIYLYGEEHGVQKIIEAEFSLWKDYYEDGMRHLFAELPYYTAELLNVWMKEDNDEIYQSIFDEWDGTASANPYTFTFYKNIKEKCPETIFHGTDVGHQYDSTGKKYLTYLESKNLKDSQQYARALEVIEQGKSYYSNKNSKKGDIEREQNMVKNFIYELGTVNNEDIMGIYGSAHAGLNNPDNTGSIPCMANQLDKLYVNQITSEDLRVLMRDIDPLRIETIMVSGREYKAYYYGQQDLSWLKGYAYREFWHLENSYENLKDSIKTGDVLPFDNYPMIIKTGEVYVVDYIKADNSVERKLYIADGRFWNGRESTEEILVK